MLFVLNQKISFIIQLLWHQLNQKLTFFMLNGGNGIRKEVCTVSRFLFMFPWHFINGIFIIYIVDQSICFEQLKYGIMCVCVPWQVKFWLRLFARFLRHVWHQKHENFVVLVLVTWQYLVFDLVHLSTGHNTFSGIERMLYLLIKRYQRALSHTLSKDAKFRISHSEYDVKIFAKLTKRFIYSHAE